MTESSAPITNSPEPGSDAAASARPTGPASTVPANYILQLGTYRLKESALDDQKHFRSMGIATIILRRGEYFVLRLPPFDTREEAEREESRLRQRGLKPMFIPPIGSEE
jgi:cell division protein FtsN